MINSNWAARITAPSAFRPAAIAVPARPWPCSRPRCTREGRSGHHPTTGLDVAVPDRISAVRIAIASQRCRRSPGSPRRRRRGPPGHLHVLDEFHRPHFSVRRESSGREAGRHRVQGGCGVRPGKPGHGRRCARRAVTLGCGCSPDPHGARDTSKDPPEALRPSSTNIRSVRPVPSRRTAAFSSSWSSSRLAAPPGAGDGMGGGPGPPAP